MLRRAAREAAPRGFAARRGQWVEGPAVGLLFRGLGRR